MSETLSCPTHISSNSSERCIDVTFSRGWDDYGIFKQEASVSRESSEDFIEITFPRELPSPDGLDSDGEGQPDGCKGGKPMELITGEFKEVRFPRVSENNLKIDIEDFYISLIVGLNSLQRHSDSFFLSANFLLESISLMESLDSDVRILLEKFAEVRLPRPRQAIQAIADYDKHSEKILSVCNVLRFTMEMLKGYQNSQVEAVRGALESLVAISGSQPRVFHVSQATKAISCIDACHDEMVKMQVEARILVESGSDASLSNLVPNLNSIQAESDLQLWTGISGALFAMTAVTSYICQLLLAAFAHSGEGPTLIANANEVSFNRTWATCLLNLHIHARLQFNRMKESSRTACCFMSRDNDRLGFMLEDIKRHLESLQVQGKFLNFGGDFGSWKNYRKKLKHNVPLFGKHLLDTRDNLSKLCKSLESLSSQITQGKQYLSKL